jgi:predicted GNAT family N-acyltransferase
MTVKIERFDVAKKYNNINKFDCDNLIVNKFVHNSLKAQVKAGTSVAWALVDTANQDSFVGFYTLMMSQVSQQLLANISSQSLPYRVPCVRLVMLGVDIKYKQNGYGKRLMKHALLETNKAADMIGCRGIYLDSDPNAVSFYTGLGFTLLETPVDPKSPIPMFLFKESFF